MAERCVILAILVLARTTMGFQFQSLAAIGARLTGEAGLSHAALGLLIGFYLLPGVAFALPAGWLVQRFGDRRLTLVGLALMTGGGVALALAQELPMMMAARLISGAGAVLLNVLLAKMVADWFAEREIVPAMGLLITSWPLGIALAMITLPSLTMDAPIGRAALVATMPAALALALVAAIYRAPSGRGSRPPAARARLHPDEIARTICAGTVWAFYNAGFICLIAFAADLLIARAAAPAPAVATVSVVGWLIIPSRAMGVYFTCYYLAMAVVPPLAGAVQGLDGRGGGPGLARRRMPRGRRDRARALRRTAGAAGRGVSWPHAFIRNPVRNQYQQSAITSTVARLQTASPSQGELSDCPMMP